MKKILIVGLGLIGGSMAKALKRNTSHRILGLDIREETLLDACSLGVIDAKATPEDIADADILYLCTYPDEAVSFIEKYGTMLKRGCIVTDTCGVKTAICSQIEKIGGAFHFVGAHPMAGKEKHGFSASDPSIFIGSSYIITPERAPAHAVNTVAELAKSMGFGRIVYTTPAEHDKMIAFTSQIPHVIACAYVLSPACEFHEGFSAGSYRDVSRVADINAPLWNRLFLENKQALVSELDIFLQNVQSIRDSIEREDGEQLMQLLETAASVKRRDPV